MKNIYLTSTAFLAMISPTYAADLATPKTEHSVEGVVSYLSGAAYIVKDI